MTSQDVFLRLFLVFLLIALNAFFVAAEFSIVSVRRSRISQLVEAGDLQAQTVQSLQRSIARLLSTTQLGITLASLALGWIGESTVAILVQKLFLQLPIPASLQNTFSHLLSIPIAFFLVAYLQIVLGELCPKSVALINSEQLARFLAGPIGVISQIFNPFISILNQSTRCLLRLLRIEYDDTQWYNRVTSEELQLIISTEIESSGLEAEERAILKNVFEFGDVTAEEVMIPRTRLIAVPYAPRLLSYYKKSPRQDFSRYPVKGDSLDDIRGVIDFKDLALPLSKGQITPESPINLWLKPVRFFPKSTLLSELLEVMQRSQLKMIVVVDEFGGTSGLVTLQDLIAEILGDKALEESEAVIWQMLDEQTFLVQAQMNLEEVNEVLNLTLPLADEYQTLGGFLLYRWQKIPQQGETLNYKDLEFTVVSAEGPRLGYIRIHRREPKAIYLDNEALSTDLAE